MAGVAHVPSPESDLRGMRVRRRKLTITAPCRVHSRSPDRTRPVEPASRPISRSSTVSAPTAGPFRPSLLDMLRTTLDAIRPSAIKIGMLGTDDAVRNTTLALGPFPEIPVVIDPILLASDGSALLERRAYPALRDLAFRKTLLTPNWPEMETLMRDALPRRRDGEAAAKQLVEELELGGLLLKGGHLDGDADDLLVLRDADGAISSEWLPGERIAGAPVHGTGCALSAAITAGLAQGRPLRETVVSARAFIREAIAGATTLPNGARLLALS